MIGITRMKQNSVAVAVISTYLMMIDYLGYHLLISTIFTHFVCSLEKLQMYK